MRRTQPTQVQRRRLGLQRARKQHVETRRHEIRPKTVRPQAVRPQAVRPKALPMPSDSLECVLRQSPRTRRFLRRRGRLRRLCVWRRHRLHACSKSAHST